MHLQEQSRFEYSFFFKDKEKLKFKLCDANFDSERFLNINTKNHFYNSYRRKSICNKCESECNSVETLEVHLGKYCSDYIECGLCYILSLIITELMLSYFSLTTIIETAV